MKKLLIIPAVVLLTGCFTKPETPEDVALYTNQAPNNIRVNMEIGYSHSELAVVEVINNDVYINDNNGDEWNNSYFAHLKDGSYEYYKKDVKNNGDWASFVPVTTDRENPSTYDALRALTGEVSSMIANVFNIEAVNYNRYTGTEVINGEETTIYVVSDFTYYVSEKAKMNMKILPADGLESDWSVEVKSYQAISSFTDSPTF